MHAYPGRFHASLARTARTHQMVFCSTRKAVLSPTATKADDSVINAEPVVKRNIFWTLVHLLAAVVMFCYAVYQAACMLSAGHSFEDDIVNQFSLYGLSIWTVGFCMVAPYIFFALLSVCFTRKPMRGLRLVIMQLTYAFAVCCLIYVHQDSALSMMRDDGDDDISDFLCSNAAIDIVIALFYGVVLVFARLPCLFKPRWFQARYVATD